MTARRYGDGTYGSGTYGLPNVPADPAVVVEILTPAGWVDVTCDARSIVLDRGRSSYLDAARAATAALDFADFDGRFSPWNPASYWLQASPYATDVPIRVTVADAANGLVYRRFTGSTDAITDTWPEQSGWRDAIASVSATDGFKLLARHEGLARPPVGANERSGARIGRLAADAAWAGPSRLDAGTIALQQTDLAGVTLDLMRAVGVAEWGWLYVDVDGALVFRQRDAVSTDPRMVNVQWTFGDLDGDGVCYNDLALVTDETDVYNVATVTPVGFGPGTATDADSVAWFGPRTWTLDQSPHVSTGDATSLAQIVVLEQAASTRRVESVTFDALESPDAMAAALGVQINDRIRVIRRAAGVSIDTELLVQGIHEELTAGGSRRPASWSVTLATADALVVNLWAAWDDDLWDSGQWGV